MSDFLDQFTPDPDPDMASVQRHWVTAKPILRNAVVTYTPPYPRFTEQVLKSNFEPSCDPCCPHSCNASDSIDVMLHNACGNGFGDYHEKAWKFILGNPDTIEVALRRKIHAHHLTNLKKFLEEDVAESESLRSYWNQIKKKLDWNHASAIDQVYKLVRIGLIDYGLDDCGFSTFEFQTGWDHDHGMSVLMHKTEVLAAEGMGEFTYFASDPIGHIRAIQQAHGLDDGDFSLLES